MVQRRLNFTGIAIEVLAAFVLAEPGMLRVPEHVMADIQVEVAIVVQVGEGSRGRIGATARQPRAVRRIFERPVAPLALQRVGLQAGDEEVGVAVVIVIPHGYAQSVASTPGDRGDLRAFGRVGERTVAAVAEEPVATSGTGILPVIRTHGLEGRATRGEGTAL